MRPVPIPLPEIAVVQAEHVAFARVPYPILLLTRILLGVRRDLLHSLDEPLRRLHSPVAWNQTPHSRLQTVLLRNFSQPRIAESKRWPKPSRPFQQHLRNRLVAQ